MTITCPHCGYPVAEPWHRKYGLQKLEKGWVEFGVPTIGRINLQRQNIAMVYICEVSRLPFLVVLKTAK